MDKPPKAVIFYSKDRQFQLQLPESAIKEMLRICCGASEVETGGILVGMYSGDHNRAIVDRITGPPSDSQHLLTRFFRGITGLQELLNSLWAIKNKRFYLGEWHYHPMPFPAPSSDDFNQMKEIATSKQYACPEPILIIVSGSLTDDWQLSVTVHLGNGTIIELERGKGG